MARILVIDDDPVIVRIYAARLGSEGHTVTTAGTAALALAAASAATPDLVLLDLMLPDRPGVEVLRELRARPATARVPVVVLSNAYLEEDMAAARAAGATALAAKATCGPKQVGELVRRHLAATPGPAAVAVPPVALPPIAAIPLPVNVRLPDLAAPPTIIGGDEQAGQRIVTSVLAEVRLEMLGLRKATPTARREMLARLHRRLHQVLGAATVAGRSACADLAAASAALVKALGDFPDRLGLSSLTTLAHACDVIERAMGAGTDVPVAKARALIVDDDAVARATMRHALAKIALPSDEADSGEKALDRLRTMAYAIVLTDVNMARMSGYSLISRLRELPIHRQTPVILVTGLADFGQGFQPSARGAADCIAKPFLLMELAVKTLTHLLESAPAVAAVELGKSAPARDLWDV